MAQPLALADLFPQKRFTYIGIDSARVMRNRGDALLKAAVKRRIVHKRSSISFESNWDSLAVNHPTGSAIMFNFAFFFASKTLRTRDLKSLAGRIEQIGSASGSGILSYTNSIYPIANENYDRFLDILQVKPKAGRINRTVRFRNRRHHIGAPAVQEFSRELYELEF